MGTASPLVTLVDIITDFNPSEDRIELTHSLTFSQLQLTAENGDVLIQVAAIQEFLGILQGVNLPEVDPTNFIC